MVTNAISTMVAVERASFGNLILNRFNISDSSAVGDLSPISLDRLVSLFINIIVRIPENRAPIDTRNPSRMAQPQPVFTNASNCPHRSRILSAIPASMVITALVIRAGAMIVIRDPITFA